MPSSDRVSVPAPIGADAVVPPRGCRGSPRAARLARLRARARGALEAGRGVRVARGVRVRVDGGRVRLGDGCLLGPGCRIEAAGGTVEIGAGARIGERSVIVALARGARSARGATRRRAGRWSPTSSRPARDVEMPRARCSRCAPRPIAVGDGARIGAHAALGAGRAGRAPGRRSAPTRWCRRRPSSP